VFLRLGYPPAFNLSIRANNSVFLRDIGHVVPIVDISGNSVLVHQDLGRHAPQFEQINFLSVTFQDGMFRVGDADEGEGMLFEVIDERGSLFWTDDQDRGLALLKFHKVLAQLRHVRAAEGSLETAVEDQQDIGLALKI